MSGRMKGVVVGLVTDLNDPEGLARIKVEYPWLPEGSEGTWVGPAPCRAGAGLYFLPELATGAGGEMDDIRRCVLGSLWSGSAPLEHDPNIRLIRRLGLGALDGTAAAAIKIGQLRHGDRPQQRRRDHRRSTSPSRG